MTSSVFFKFKSQKEPSRVEFDGTGISVFELKRDIIIKSGLGDGTDFDLAIYNEDGNEEYDDDTTIIPRSTSIIARRLPPSKPGAGRAARYMSGKMPVNAKNSARKEQSLHKPFAKSATSTNGLAQLNSAAMTEEEREAAMFQAQSENWNAQQEEMANQTPVFRPGGKKGQPPVPDHEPPTGYICYRCGEKGHWIQVCPTNDDPSFDNKPRVKRTTGIPRSFLKTVERPVALANDGTIDDTKAPVGVMVNAEGEFVVAEPDKVAWEKFQAKTKSAAAAQQAAAQGDRELQERGLECSIDKRIFIDPMKTPCCEKTYCNECITNALMESDLVCPGCQTEQVLIDDLQPDTETSEKIKLYLEEKNAAAKEKERSKSPIVKAESPPTANSTAKSASPIPESPLQVKGAEKAKSKSPIPETSPARDEAKSKKRPADELLENPKIPKGPKAMQQQETQKKLIQQQATMNGMPNIGGFSNMPFNMPNQFYGGNGFGSMPLMNGFMPNPMMMNPMMGMNNYGGFPNMNGMNGFGAPGGFGGMNGMNGMGMGMSNKMVGGAQGTQAPQVNSGAGAAGGFSNQQKTVFAEPLPDEEDNAYFRKPVNPHRHQSRQRRARPSDYREL